MYFRIYWRNRGTSRTDDMINLARTDDGLAGAGTISAGTVGAKVGANRLEVPDCAATGIRRERRA